MRCTRAEDSRTGAIGLALLAGVLLVGVGCASDDLSGGNGDGRSFVATTSSVPIESSPQVRGVDLWVRMPAVGQTVAAAYGEIINDTDAEVIVRSVRSDVGRAELHETTSDPQGVVRMRERTEGFALAPGVTLTLEPGAAHVMLFEVDMLSLRLAEVVTLEFEIADWGILKVSAPVRELDAPSEHAEHAEQAEHAEHDEQMAGEAGLALDIAALHGLDDDLHAGIFDPDVQRQVVADALATLAVIEVPADFDRDALISALETLDQALIAADVPVAAQWAFIVHDLAHALEPHHSH